MANFTVLNLTLISFFFFLGNVDFVWASKTSCRVDDFADSKLEIVDFLPFFSLGRLGGVEEQMSAYYSSQVLSANMALEHHLPTGSRIAALPKDTPAGSGLAPTPQNLNRNHKR